MFSLTFAESVGPLEVALILAADMIEKGRHISISTKIYNYTQPSWFMKLSIQSRDAKSNISNKALRNNATGHMRKVIEPPTRIEGMGWKYPVSVRTFNDISRCRKDGTRWESVIEVFRCLGNIFICLWLLGYPLSSANSSKTITREVWCFYGSFSSSKFSLVVLGFSGIVA